MRKKNWDKIGDKYKNMLHNLRELFINFIIL